MTYLIEFCEKSEEASNSFATEIFIDSGFSRTKPKMGFSIVNQSCILIYFFNAISFKVNNFTCLGWSFPIGKITTMQLLPIKNQKI